MNTDIEITPKEIASASKLSWVIPLAIAAATAANVILYFILTGPLKIALWGANFDLPSPVRVLIPVTDIVIFSLVFASGASIVFVIVVSVAKRPMKDYVIISFVVLVLSFLLPLKIPPLIPMSTKLSLISMHIVGAVVVVGILVSLGRSRHSEVWLGGQR